MRIKELRERRNIRQKELAEALGVAQNTFSQYETGKREPDFHTTQCIADYFGVTVDYLLGRDNKKAPTLTKKDERDIAADLHRIMGNLEGSGDLMFDGVPMSPDAIDSLRAAMKLGLDAVKMKNKETYTPKKYRSDRGG